MLGPQTTADDDALLQDLLEVMQQQIGRSPSARFATFQLRSPMRRTTPTLPPPSNQPSIGSLSAARPPAARHHSCSARSKGAASAAPAEAERSEQLRRRAEELGRAPPAAKHKHDVARWGVWLRTYVRRLQREEIDDAAAWRSRMRSVNPRVVLRNWVAQEAIEAAEAGDTDVVERVLRAITHPFDESADEALGMRSADR